MKQGICYLVCAGKNTGLDFTPTANDYVIAVDGGLRYLEEAHITPNLIIGDFDTLGYCPTHSNVVRLNPQKDDTDTLAALKEGILEGFSQFHLYCGTGGRIEHTIANIQCLIYLKNNGARGYILDGGITMSVLREETVAFGNTEEGYLSLFSLGEKAEGVTITGMKYPLTDAKITNDYPIGISNEFIGEESRIEVKRGMLLLILSQK